MFLRSVNTETSGGLPLLRPERVGVPTVIMTRIEETSDVFRP